MALHIFWSICSGDIQLGQQKYQWGLDLSLIFCKFLLSYVKTQNMNMKNEKEARDGKKKYILKPSQHG